MIIMKLESNPGRIVANALQNSATVSGFLPAKAQIATTSDLYSSIAFITKLNKQRSSLHGLRKKPNAVYYTIMKCRILKLSKGITNLS